MTVRRPEPAAVDYKGRRFLITDRPTDLTMTKYIQVRRRYARFPRVTVVATGVERYQLSNKSRSKKKREIKKNQWA